jgi:hypothetical protein
MMSRFETRILSSRPIKTIVRGLGDSRYRALFDSYSWMRAQKLPTKLFGPRHTRSRSRIELDITYRCNLKCINCNRSCRQAPSNEYMTVEQIQRFIKESIESNVKWESIRVMGGEPTLHPDLLKILTVILEYKKHYSAAVRIVLVTNGYDSKVSRILSEVPAEIEIENSKKTSEVNKFTTFNKAPQDSFLFKNADFSNGCWMTFHSGIGLTPHGYYCCAVGGSIDRVFGFDVGRKKLPSNNDDMIDQLQLFCKLCGHFPQSHATTTCEVTSASWKAAYNKYRQMNPSLSLY